MAFTYTRTSEDERKHGKLRALIDRIKDKEVKKVLIAAVRGQHEGELSKLESVISQGTTVRTGPTLAQIIANVPQKPIRTRLTEALACEGITAEGLTDKTRHEILKIKNLGRTSCRELAKAMAQFGIYFDGEGPETFNQ